MKFLLPLIDHFCISIFLFNGLEIRWTSLKFSSWESAGVIQSCSVVTCVNLHNVSKRIKTEGFICYERFLLTGIDWLIAFTFSYTFVSSKSHACCVNKHIEFNLIQLNEFIFICMIYYLLKSIWLIPTTYIYHIQWIIKYLIYLI